MFEFFDFINLKNDEIILNLIEKRAEDPNKNRVPAYVFGIYLRASFRPIGQIDIRIGHNKGLYYGGNIGYWIDPEYRGHHYAQKACRLILEVAKKHQMEYLYITCNPDNIASKKTCEALGLEFIEIAPLPCDNDMYLDGEREKCIYLWRIT